MGKTIAKLALAGAVVVAAIKIFQVEQQIAGTVISRTRTGLRRRDPEQLAVAAMLLIGLGLFAVVAAQAFRTAVR